MRRRFRSGSTQEDIDKISQAAREDFTEVFTEAYQKAGLEVVTTPGPDVLRLRPGVVDLYIVAPDNMSSRHARARTRWNPVRRRCSSSCATRRRERCSAAALDRRATRNTGRVQISNSVTNLSDFKRALQAMGGHQRQGIQGPARDVAGADGPEARPETEN